MKKGLEINVAGAGYLLIGNTPTCMCGVSIGFHFDVSWSRFGLSSGVISKEDAVLLANHILDAVKNA